MVQQILLFYYQIEEKAEKGLNPIKYSHQIFKLILHEKNQLYKLIKESRI